MSHFQFWGVLQKCKVPFSPPPKGCLKKKGTLYFGKTLKFEKMLFMLGEANTHPMINVYTYTNVNY
jgi:hypothetical protein